MSAPRRLLLLLALFLSAAPAARADDHALNFLLSGVKSIASPGTPGSLATWGEGDRAPFAVVPARIERDLHAPVVAAGFLGAGRVVAFAHSGYADAPAMNEGDTARLLLNALDWSLRRRALRDDQRPLVGVHAGGLHEWLRAAHPDRFDAVRLEGRNWSDRLPGADLDILILAGASLTDAQVAAIDRFVRDGGGLIAAQTGWGWQQLSGDPPKSMRENALNRLLAPAGIAWTDETVDDTLPEPPGGFDAATPPSPLVTGGPALRFLLADDDDRGPVVADDRSRRQAAAPAIRAVRALPDHDATYRPRLAAALERSAADLVPTPDRPLGRRDDRARFLLACQVEALARADPADIRPHPASAAFPGAVDPAQPRISVRRTIDLRAHGRHSLGLYAPPGEIVTIRFPAAPPRGLAVRIGAHSDRLWHHAQWRRVPDIDLQRPITASETRLASPFGGLLYIESPAGLAPATIEFDIVGGVESPLFVLGTTSPDQWRAMLADARAGRPVAPWAELASSKVILTVPTAEVLALDDPVALLEFWDRALDMAADLAAIPRDRPRPERYVADVQISAGYMHAGYPIMTHLDAAAHMVSLDRLRRGAWGLFHELGHNHQAPEWTFDGTGEVTCNLFSLILSQRLCGIADADAHDALKNPTRYVGPYFARDARDPDARFREWKANPFLALHMYRQLLDAFGWDTYHRVFAEYAALTPAERPRSDDQKRDQWLVRFSRAAGRNLGPFFEAWGVPTSQAARDSLADLPDWMPERIEEVSGFRP